MKLEKAIEIQEKLVRNAPSWSPIDKVDALKLLIEAGKAIKEYRRRGIISFTRLLPGETEETEEPLAVEALYEQIEASLKREAEKRRGKHEPDDKG